MSRRGERGFTLLELLITVVVLGSFVSSATIYFQAQHRSSEQSAGYAQDIRDMSRLMEHLEADLRTGKHLSHFGWEQRGSVVYRGKQRVAHRVERFDVERDGRVVTVSVTPLPRRAARASKNPILKKRIVLRAGGA